MIYDCDALIWGLSNSDEFDPILSPKTWEGSEQVGQARILIRSLEPAKLPEKQQPKNYFKGGWTLICAMCCHKNSEGNFKEMRGQLSFFKNL